MFSSPALSTPQEKISVVSLVYHQGYEEKNMHFSLFISVLKQ